MSVIRTDEIRGYNYEGRIYCPDCWAKIDPEAKVDLKEQDYILDGEVEGDDSVFHFCDECGSQL